MFVAAWTCKCRIAAHLCFKQSILVLLFHLDGHITDVSSQSDCRRRHETAMKVLHSLCIFREYNNWMLSINDSCRFCIVMISFMTHATSFIVKAAFFGPTVAISSFEAEKRSEVGSVPTY